MACSLTERDDDVIICSVTLQEEYEGWVVCLHVGCNERVPIWHLDAHLDSHSESPLSPDFIHSDLALARCIQESENQLISANDRDFQLALSLHNQSQRTVLSSAKHSTPPSAPGVPTRLLHTTAQSTSHRSSNASYSSTQSAVSTPHNTASRPPGSNIHTLSDLTSPVRGQGQGQGGGGYKAQTLKQLEQQVNKGHITSYEYHSKKLELSEDLSSGRDNLLTCTEGAIESLLCSYRLFTPACRFYLSSDTPHFSYSYGDRGWGCGYRNIQMIVGSLLRSDRYKGVMNRTFKGQIPTVPRLQELLDGAWRAGYDPKGARELGHQVRETRKWIGATEAAVLFRSFGVKAEIVDFTNPTGPGKTHTRLLQWVEEYFRESGGADRTNQPPLYLQHSGHSRTIIGWGQYRNNTYLTLLDPSIYPDKLRKSVRSREKDLVSLLSRISTHFVKPQYQIVFFKGLIETHKQEAYKSISPYQHF